MGNNHIKVSEGFRILLYDLAPYIAQELRQVYGNDWWQRGVMEVLNYDSRKNLPEFGEWDELVDSLDIQRALLLLDLNWQHVFRRKLAVDHRTWAKELQGVRNRLAHLGGNDFSDDDTWRALDTMSRLADAIEPEGAEEIRTILRELRYGSAEGSTTTTQEVEEVAPTAPRPKEGILASTPVSSLKPWREVMQPHPDVAQGRYKNAEFAADLAQVARGEGAYEYRDPVEFFARTYVTEGMAGLLEQAWRRVTGGAGGEPVIQLKTAFGGGKTHSMLALYHMMRGTVSIDKIPNIKPVLKQAGVSSLPRCNVAVLVGTALNPTKSRRPNNLPGITINTLWGEMAAQLAESAGDLKIYDIIRDSDRKGVSPGSATLKELFDAAGPCLVLMDEIVAYAKKIWGATDLPAGTYDNLITFIQEITEAASASKNSMVVASIPESELEIGGEAGQTALDTIEHTFGRKESVWKPVAAKEGFEVVRRRLFLNCRDEDARDKVCEHFSQMYVQNAGDFPMDARELEYKQRMISCYPIHPEIFDRLYNDWSTLDKFQRTRGVLRLMAAVIHELWMGNDGGLLIMPGSLPLNVPLVKDELTRYLSENWNAVVDQEVDGKQSIPYQKDQAIVRFGNKMACRRVARTVMLGSAPTSADQAVRGLEASRVRLGVVQPGENIADFNDALSTLQNSLAYLYNSGDRYWYDTRPTLRKTMEDRATQVAASEVEHAIEEKLRRLRREAPFQGLHTCPASSQDVPDDQTARLVVLGPNDEHKSGQNNSCALTAAEDILNHRGSSPRMYRNMLSFVAPDQDAIVSLKQEVRRLLAWQSIKNDAESIGLDLAQVRETNANIQRSEQTVDARILEAYRWLMVPYVDREGDLKQLQWHILPIPGAGEGIVQKAAGKMQQNEYIISQWAPLLLKMELDRLLWKDADHIKIKDLWDHLSRYTYLPRLASYSVLEKTISLGINSREYFAYADGFVDGRYLDLKWNQFVGFIDTNSLLVKVDAARKQLDEEEAQHRAEQAAQEGKPTGAPMALNDPTREGDRHVPSTGGQPEPIRNTRFYLSADLDNTRINRDVQDLLVEVINHLQGVEGSQVKITLEVQAEMAQGTPVPVVRTVTENCATLRVRSYGFEG